MNHMDEDEQDLEGLSPLVRKGNRRPKRHPVSKLKSHRRCTRCSSVLAENGSCKTCGATVDQIGGRKLKFENKSVHRRRNGRS